MAERQQKPALTLSNAEELKICIIQAEFNNDITDQQRESAEALLQQYSVQYDVRTVAGSFELPVVASNVLNNGYDAVVAIGCLIKGESMHFEVIAYGVAAELARVSVERNAPVGFGVITALNRQQAEERTWIGEDAAYATLQALQAMTA